jgi:hypothetical protein
VHRNVVGVGASRLGGSVVLDERLATSQVVGNYLIELRLIWKQCPPDDKASGKSPTATELARTAIRSSAQSVPTYTSSAVVESRPKGVSERLCSSFRCFGGDA